MRPHSLAAAERERLARILGMTGSAHSGEALNAARMANRILRESGANWFDALSAPKPEEPESGEDQFAAWGGWRAAARTVALHGGGLISEWERRFALSLTAFPRISPKQEALLRDITRKVELAGVGP